MLYYQRQWVDEAGARERLRSPNRSWRIRIMQAIRVKRTFQEPWSVYRANLQAIVSFSSSIQLEMMLTHQHQLGQISGESSSNKVQRMHRYDRNCLCVWKIARNLKLATRLKLLWPVSNCKRLGLGRCCTVFGPSSALWEVLSQHFHHHGQRGVRQTMEKERLLTSWYTTGLWKWMGRVLWIDVGLLETGKCRVSFWIFWP